MKHIRTIIAGIATAAVAISCEQSAEQQQALPTVKVDTVRTASSSQIIQFPGRVKAAQDISLSFRVSGTISRIHIDEGGSVKAGQLIAELDPSDYATQLSATQAEYNQIKAQVDRVTALYNDGAATPSDYDKARYGLQQIEAKLQHHRDQLAYTKIYAPFDGYVLKRHFGEHETLGAGMPVVSVMSSAANEVEIFIPASEYTHRKHFSNYSCTFDIFEGKTFALKPVSISPKANANQLYAMTLRLPAGSEPSPGMTTMVTIQCAADTSAQMLIPASAVFQSEGKSNIFIYNADNNTVKQHAVKVERLLSDGRCIITAPSVAVGDIVVTSGVKKIADGEEVALLPKATATNVGGLL